MGVFSLVGVHILTTKIIPFISKSISISIVSALLSHQRSDQDDKSLLNGSLRNGSLLNGSLRNGKSPGKMT